MQRTPGEPLGVCDNRLPDSARARRLRPLRGPRQPLITEELLPAARLRQPIRHQQQAVTGQQAQRLRLVLGVPQGPQQHPALADLLRRAARA